MAAILKIPGTSITGVPVPPVDARLSAGSLLLIDPTHPAAPFTASPAAGAAVPNIAASQAAALLGSPLPSVSLFAAADNKRARITRTSKGRLHFTSSETLDEAGDRAGIAMMQSLRDYLLINSSHTYYLGTALVPTRVKVPTSASTNQVAGIFQSTDFGSGRISTGWTAAGTPAALPGSSSADRLGFSTQANGADVFTAITAASLGLTSIPTSYIAAAGPWGGVNNVHNTSSFVLGSLYLEDLTVSKRSHADVAALDLEAFEYAAASRWAGDTWSAPLT